LLSAPFQLKVDTANACQLACPACVHTSNEDYAARFDWPRTTLQLDLYDQFLDRLGPFAFYASIYNYGEPLLNKRFPEFVQHSKKYLLCVATSTNLSMPLADTDSIVASGLDKMVLSIDGATQETYARYRRKGKLDLVLENVRNLVASKKRLGVESPYLVWQFLTFEHNAHEVDAAIRMARELGVNEINVVTPFAVDTDDPGIRAVTIRRRGRYTFAAWDGRWCSRARRQAVAQIAPRVEALFNRSWESRLHESGGSGEASHPQSSTCDWLYHNITLDGAARLMPCCMAPDKQDKFLVFERLSAGGGDGAKDWINSPMARLARLSFQNRKAYEAEVVQMAREDQPFCARCKETPKTYGLANVAADIRNLDENRILPRPLQWALAQWAG
jgi:hypothetical protein